MYLREKIISYASFLMQPYGTFYNVDQFLITKALLIKEGFAVENLDEISYDFSSLFEKYNKTSLLKDQELLICIDWLEGRKYISKFNNGRL